MILKGISSFLRSEWDRRDQDFGLGVYALILACLNISFVIFGTLFFNGPDFLAFLPLILVFFCYKARDFFVSRGEIVVFTANALMIITSLVIDYFLIGEMDRAIGGLDRLDDFCVRFDQFLFNMPVATYIYKLTSVLGSFQFLFYDAIMTIYYLYFILPLFSGLFVFSNLKKEDRWMIGRFFLSFLLSYIINFFLYMLVPVTGPQYFIPEKFDYSLPLSKFGFYLHAKIYAGQLTFIDCFPSGHVWITLLVTIWLFEVKSKLRFFLLGVLVMMMLATLGLRYHYSIDLIASFILAWPVFKISCVLYSGKLENS